MLPRLKTDRSVALRPYEDADRSVLAAMFADGEQMALIFGGKPIVGPELDAFLLRYLVAYEDLRCGMAVVCCECTNTVVGHAGIVRCEYLGVPDYEFGFALVPDCQGKGFATALGRALIQYALDSMNLSRVLATVHPSNAPSLRVMNKLGLRFVADLETRERGPRRVFAAVRQ